MTLDNRGMRRGEKMPMPAAGLVKGRDIGLRMGDLGGDAVIVAAGEFIKGAHGLLLLDPTLYDENGNLNNMILRNRVCWVVAETFSVPVDSVSESTEPNDITHWDSLGHMNLIAEVEGAFGVTFEVDEITEAVNVGAIVRLLREKGINDE